MSLVPKPREAVSGRAGTMSGPLDHFSELSNVPQERRIHRRRGPRGVQHQGRLSNHGVGL